MDINKYLEEQKAITRRHSSLNLRIKELSLHLVCEDGFTMSVQVNRTHCPRVDNLYESVEIGYPSQREPLIAEYAEDENDLTGTVYGYVPVDIVNAVIEKHGGIK